MTGCRMVGKILTMATFTLSMLALTGCSTGTVVLEGGKIEKVDGGWLVPDSQFAELLECCERNIE